MMNFAQDSREHGLSCNRHASETVPGLTRHPWKHQYRFGSPCSVQEKHAFANPTKTHGKRHLARATQTRLQIVASVNAQTQRETSEAPPSLAPQDETALCIELLESASSETASRRQKKVHETRRQRHANPPIMQSDARIDYAVSQLLAGASEAEVSGVVTFWWRRYREYQVKPTTAASTTTPITM